MMAFVNRKLFDVYVLSKWGNPFIIEGAWEMLAVISVFLPKLGKGYLPEIMEKSVGRGVVVPRCTAGVGGVL